MRIGESTFARLPEHLQRLFNKLPNLGSAEVVAGFPERDGGAFPETQSSHEATSYSVAHGKIAPARDMGDSGSAARFFYTAKADSDDRLGSKHPTVKPLDLMQYLCRLVCHKGGTVLDLFAGTGTTGEAAFREGMRAVLIEADAGYQADIRRRIELLMAGPDERLWAAVKEKTKDKPRDDGPLFGGKSDWEEMWEKPFQRPELVWGKDE